jgi:hypothetical protein
VSARLIYPEGRTALAQANRLGRLTGRQLRVAVDWPVARDHYEVGVVDSMSRGQVHGVISPQTMSSTASLAIREHNLLSGPIQALLPGGHFGSTSCGDGRCGRNTRPDRPVDTLGDGNDVPDTQP